jgi:hypothetical protein
MLRALDSWSTFRGFTDADRTPPVFLLGTSRTQVALSPAVIEATLSAAGIAQPWVANISRNGVTTTGLYRTYLKEIHPWAEQGSLGGLVAVEVGPAGFNDFFQTPSEIDFLAENGISSPLMAHEWPWERVPHTAFSRIRLFRKYEDLAITWRIYQHRLLGDQNEPGWRVITNWSRNDKGWKPLRKKPPEDLSESYWRERYTTHFLSDYQVGGLQTDSLKSLVETIREDGFRPLLYRLPVTDIQRSFYRPEDWDRAKAVLTDFGRREGVDLLDLSAAHHVAPEDWFDTHHIAITGTDDISARFARELLNRGHGD